jgi:hypothetical protein
MKKFIFAFVLPFFLLGCNRYESSITVEPQERILQYLESHVLTEPDTVCVIEPLAKPAANIVEVWTLCTSPSRKEKVSTPVKITFLGETTTHFVPSDGTEYDSSVKRNFSKIATRHILNYQRNIDMTLLDKRLVKRAAEKDFQIMEY